MKTFTRTTKHVTHEPCPRCGSRDNLARYPDGSAWCFGCRYLERAPSTLASYTQSVALRHPDSIALPTDLTSVLPPLALKWLLSYNLTLEEIENEPYYWSSNLSGLCYCCTNAAITDGYEVRFFPARTPKTRSYGSKVRMSMSMLRCTTKELPLIFVEDVVSCIKVSRYFPCISLFGSNLSLELLEWGLESFGSFRLWLDPDKKKSSVEQCLNYRQKGYDISPVFSDYDPKELSDNEIRRILWNSS